MQTNTNNTTNNGIDYAITIIEDDQSDSYQPPVIDLDTHTQYHGTYQAIYYNFEFDMSNDAHSFGTMDIIDVVIAPKTGSPHSFTAEVVTAGSHVVRIESWVQPIDNGIGDVLDQADTWISTTPQSSAVEQIAVEIPVSDIINELNGNGDGDGGDDDNE